MAELQLNQQTDGISEDVDFADPELALFIEETKNTWSDILGVPVDEEFAKDIIQNMTALAELLVSFQENEDGDESDGS